MEFSRTARYYHLLEDIFIGRALQKTRVAQLQGRPVDPVQARFLIVGEGNGRFLEALMLQYPDLHVTIVDESESMLNRAKARLERMSQVNRNLEFHAADIKDLDLPKGAFTHIVTNFFFSNFLEDEVSSICRKLEGAACEEAEWWLGDFTIPPSGLKALRAKLWLNLLYAFFGATAGVSTRALPEIAHHIKSHGFVCIASQAFSGSMLQSSVFRRSQS